MKKYCCARGNEDFVGGFCIRQVDLQETDFLMLRDSLFFNGKPQVHQFVKTTTKDTMKKRNVPPVFLDASVHTQESK